MHTRVHNFCDLWLTATLRENLFVSPKILVSSIYSDSESGPGSEYDGDDGCHEQSEPEKSSVEDSSDDSTENETCTSKKMKLSKSPRKSSTTSRLLAVRSCTPGKTFEEIGIKDGLQRKVEISGPHT